MNEEFGCLPGFRVQGLLLKFGDVFNGLGVWATG